jgi:16S rRNA (guanine966-N2)-methyltransferase
MRVISGKCKGRVLYRPKSKLIRPTSDKAKEFIFNYIGDLIQNAVILDLFSGTGNLSIEALSRGAQFAVLVDNSEEAIRLIYRNLELTNFLSQSQIIKQDVLRYLKKVIHQKNKFDFIFADPPYFVNNYQNVVEYIGSDNLLQNGGFFILEHSTQKILDEHLTSLPLEKTKIFGDTAISFYKKGGN